MASGVAPWGKPATAKGKPWPGGLESTVTTYLAGLREQQPIKIICGVEGCDTKFLGRFADVRRRLDEHRTAHHPHWKPPSRRKR